MKIFLKKFLSFIISFSMIATFITKDEVDEILNLMDIAAVDIVYDYNDNWDEFLSTGVQIKENTITINSVEILVMLSHFNPELYENYDVSISQTAGEFIITEEDDFYGLGDKNHPFSKKLTHNGTKMILNGAPLFNYISTDAQVESSLQIASSINQENCLFANNIIKGKITEKLDISLILLDDSQDFGGFIGTIEKNTSVKISIENHVTIGSRYKSSSNEELYIDDTCDGYLKIKKSNGNVGFVCGNLSEDSSLELSYKASVPTDYYYNYYDMISSESYNGYSGLFIGYAKNATITINGDINGYGKVVSDKAAGGFIGYAEDTIINITATSSINIGTGIVEKTLTRDDLSKIGVAATQNYKFPQYYGLSLKGGEYAGGFIGECVYNNEQDISLEFVNVSSNFVTDGSKVNGGIYGCLRNNSDKKSIKITENNKIKSDYVSIGGNDICYGGFIGQYTALNLSNSLEINNVSIDCIFKISSDMNVAGGIIGYIGDDINSVYVNIDNCTSKLTNKDTNLTNKDKNKKFNNMGGVFGYSSNTGNMIDISNITISGDIGPGTNIGGIAGYMNNGVLRLSDNIDLSNAIFITGEHIGQILGFRGSSLIYTDGFNLKRPITQINISDIGSWGEVVRLNDKNSPLIFDNTKHIVTINDIKTTISNERDLIALALAMSCQESLGSLVFDSDKVDYSANIKIKNDIDLTDTGITGFLRDDESQSFSGELDGENNSLTLIIGQTYGLRGEKDATGSGSGQIYNHSYNGLFSKITNAEIKNIKLYGAVNIGTTGVEDIFTGVISGKADSINEITNIISDVNITTLGSDDQNYSMITGGLIGAVCDSTTVVFNACTWNSNIVNEYSSKKIRNNKAPYYIGGFIGLSYGASIIQVNDCSISGKIENKTFSTGTDAANHVGGLIADFERSTDSNIRNDASLTPSIITISGLNVQTKIINSKLSETGGVTPTGGLLGYDWWNCDVTFDNVIVKNSLIQTCGSFGGLIYYGSGHWQVGFNNENNSGIKFTTSNIFNGVTGSSPNAIFVAHGEDVGNDLYSSVTNKALFLEINWNKQDNDFSYSIEPNSIQIDGLSTDEYFDEIVGQTKTIDMTGNEKYGNGVVSLHTNNSKVDLDIEDCNTYINKIAVENNNPNTRYYYNLDTIRLSGADLADGVNSADELMCYSLVKYTKPYLQKYFKNDNVKSEINGDINLEGYSFYPMYEPGSISIKNANIVFGNEIIEEKETAANNKKTSDSKRQHYMMQTGIISDITSSDITVEDITMSGTVGKVSSGSGALINGIARGVSDGAVERFLTLSINKLSLDNLRITKFDDKNYAPLLVNHINSYSSVNISGVSTTENYNVNETTPNVSSNLIGNVGSNESIYITLVFSDMMLNGWIKDNVNKYNNTYSSIFSKSTFVNSFSYSGATSSGQYTFIESDDKNPIYPTYGVEISNSSDGTGRNPGKQDEYFDSTNKVKDNTYNKEIFSNEDYLRYVLVSEGTDGGYHEIDINQKPEGLTNGCGTYTDPYIITNGAQIEALADYLAGKTIAGWNVQFDKEILKSGTGSTDDESNHIIGTYNKKGDIWTGSIIFNDISSKNMKQYLRNAYYMISEDIDIGKTGLFDGLGSININDDDSRVSFSGVIFGKKKENGEYPVITIYAPKEATSMFGGIVQYASGCVIKDLNIEYAKNFKLKADKAGSGIKIEDIENPTEQKPQEQVFFGGVIGYAFGGDNIIDNVFVGKLDGKVSVEGDYDYLANIGGYVGLIGGNALNNGLGGGVIFRNIKTSIEDFSVTMKNGTDISSKVEADTECYENTEEDITYDAVVGTTIIKNSNQFFYLNPYVGRVLDGYACSENCSLYNTDKNYTIPRIFNDIDKLLMEDSVITIKNSQALWLTSAIVNSGAGSMNKDSTEYTQYAYKYGKVRTGTYSDIGNRENFANSKEYKDEIFWGGNDACDENKVSYLIDNYGEYISNSNSNEFSLADFTKSFSDGNLVGTKFTYGKVRIGDTEQRTRYLVTGGNAIYSLVNVTENDKVTISVNPEDSENKIYYYFVYNKNTNGILNFNSNDTIFYAIDGEIDENYLSKERNNVELKINKLISDNNIVNNKDKLYILLVSKYYSSDNIKGKLSLCAEFIKSLHINVEVNSINKLSSDIGDCFSVSEYSNYCISNFGRNYNIVSDLHSTQNDLSNCPYTIVPITSDSILELKNNSSQSIKYSIVKTLNQEQLSLNDIVIKPATEMKKGALQKIDNNTYMDCSVVIMGINVGNDSSKFEDFKKLTVNGTSIADNKFYGSTAIFSTCSNITCTVASHKHYVSINNLQGAVTTLVPEKQTAIYKQIPIENQAENIIVTNNGSKNIYCYIMDLGSDKKLSLNDTVLHYFEVPSGKNLNKSISQYRNLFSNNELTLIIVFSSDMPNVIQLLNNTTIQQTDSNSKILATKTFDVEELTKYQFCNVVEDTIRPIAFNQRSRVLYKSDSLDTSVKGIDIQLNPEYKARMYISDNNNLSGSGIVYKYHDKFSTEIIEGHLYIDDLDTVRNKYNISNLYIVVEFVDDENRTESLYYQVDKAIDVLENSEFKFQVLDSNKNIIQKFSYELEFSSELANAFIFSTSEYTITNNIFSDFKVSNGISPHQYAYYKTVDLNSENVGVISEKIIISNKSTSNIKYYILNDDKPVSAYVYESGNIAKTSSVEINLTKYKSSNLYLLVTLSISSSPTETFFKNLSSGFSYTIKYNQDKIINDLSKLSNPDVFQDIKLENNLDMTSYGNGFRGIGTAYTDNVTIKIQNRAMNLRYFYGNNHTITLERNGHEYSEETWWTQAEGLFPVYLLTANPCKIENLTISGNINIYYIDKDYLPKIGETYKSYDADIKYTAYDAFIGEACLGGFGGISAYNNAISVNSSNTTNGAQNNITNFNNVKVQNLNVEGGKYCGGIIGIAGQFNRIYRKAWQTYDRSKVGYGWNTESTILNPKTKGSIVGNYIFDSCGYTDLNIKGAYSVGGFIASIKNNTANTSLSKVVRIGGTTVINGENEFHLTRDAAYEYVTYTTIPRIYKNTAQNNADNAAKYYCYAGGGGIIGYCDASLYINNIDNLDRIVKPSNANQDYNLKDNFNIEGLTITAPQIAYNVDYGLGIVVGSINYHGGSDIYNDDSYVANITIKNSYIGTPKNKNYRNNVRTNDNDITYPIKANSETNPTYFCYQTGGMFGYVKAQLSVYNCTVDNITLVNSPWAGGVISIKNNGSINIYKTSVKNSIIYDSDVISYHGASGTGGIFGSVGSALLLEDCMVSGCVIVSNGWSGSIAAKQSSATKMNNIKISDNIILSTKSTNKVVEFKNDSMDAPNDLSKSESYATDGGWKRIRPTSEIGDNYNSVGGLIGWSESTIQGYNIALSNNSVGHILNEDGILYSREMNVTDFSEDYPVYNFETFNKDKMKNYISSHFKSDKTLGKSGKIIGYKTGDIKLAGVTIQGENQPENNIGNSENASAASYIIRSDYLGSSLLQDHNTEIVNPNNDVQVPQLFTGTNINTSDTYATVNPLLVSGSLKLTGDAVDISTRSTIIKETSERNGINGYKSANNTLQQFAQKFQNGIYSSKVTTLKSVDQKYKNDTDIPILLIDTNISKDINDMIQQYISVMTNLDQTADTDSNNLNTSKKYKYNKIVATTYEYTDTGWQIKSEPSIKVEGAGFIRVISGRHDNDNVNPQFTLLDVQYQSPYDTTKVAYHLYIPVYVKRILPFSVYASVLNDTDYYEDDYSNNNMHVISNLGDKITVYTKYNYYRSASEWEEILNSGENLLWNFNKKLYIGNNILPDGTVLKLVDINTGGLTYTLTVNSSVLKKDSIDSDYYVELNQFRKLGSSDVKWGSQDECAYICDILGVKARQVVLEENINDLSGYFIKVDADMATVRAMNDNGGYDYYRLISQEDMVNNPEVYVLNVDNTKIEKQDIQKLDTTNLNVNKDGTVDYLTESYFLTIETPKSNENNNDFINNEIIYKDNVLGACGYINVDSDFSMPTVKANKSITGINTYAQNGAESRYILSSCILSEFGISTENTNKNDVMSEECNSINVNMHNHLSITNKDIQNYLSRESTFIKLFQSFELNLKEVFEKIEDGNSETTTKFKEFVNECKISYSFSINGHSDTNEYDIIPESKLKFIYDKDDLMELLKNNIDDGIDIVCNVKIEYTLDGVEKQFPERESLSSPDGIQFYGTSHTSFSESSLDTTSIKGESYDSNHTYYREKINRAKLNYSTITIADGDATGQIGVSQLGINATDPTNNADIIKTAAYYDLSTISIEDLKKATKIKYEISLYQKDSDDKYNLTSPLIMNKYLNNIIVDGNVVNKKNDYRTVEYIKDWEYSEENLFQSLRIDYSVITGDEFEKEGFEYSNYKILLKAVTLDKNDNPISGTDVNDYIIYTNARNILEFYNK